ncbi:hypothetical protein JCM9279_002572 [Rhodotorula babjevae]
MNFTPPPPQMHHGWPPSGAPKELVDFYRDKAHAMNRAAADKDQQQQPHQDAPPPVVTYQDPPPKQQQRQQQQQWPQDGPPPVVTYRDSKDPPPEQQPYGALELHVYKDMRLFGKDDIITGPDKREMLFYLHFPVKFFSGRWDLSLRRGGPDGPEVAHIDKGHFGDSFEVSFVNGPQIKCQRTGLISTKYLFQGANGTAYYCWKSDGYFMSQMNYTLFREADLDLPKEQRRPLAHWRTSYMAFQKDGVLTINPDGMSEVELILATALGIEERARERRNRNR